MGLEILLTLALVAVIVILVVRLIKSLLTAVVTVLVILTLIIGASAFFAYRDFADLKQNFTNSSKLLVFEHKGSLVIGATVTSLENKNNVIFLKPGELTELQKKYEKKDYKGMLGSNYKMIVIKSDIITPPKTSDDAVAAIDKLLSGRGIFLVLKEYKKRNIIVYPETLVFRFLRFVPDSVLERMSGSADVKTK